jgi:hypothetical protein
MDPKRFKETYSRLEVLDDRLTYRIRSRSVKARQAPSLELVDERLRDLAEFTLELKDIVRELMLSIATKPKE